jgi:3-phytase
MRIRKNQLPHLQFLLFLLTALTVSCSTGTKDNEAKSGGTNMQLAFQHMESVEDSIELVNELLEQKKFDIKIQASAETQPVESGDGEDAADDPAIWVNHENPAKSLILGTNKTAGLYAYDLSGNILQYHKVGKLNNVDIRQGFDYKNKEVALVAGSNRSNNCITLFYIDPETAELSDSIMNIQSGVDEVYGVCFYQNNEENKYYVFVNGKGGQLEQWELTGGNSIEANLIKTFAFPSQPEGMVVNDQKGILYIGVEDIGIYKLPVDRIGSLEPMLLSGSDSLNSNIIYDIEGLALFSTDHKDYLLASIQGNFSYAIFELGENERYVSSFIIGDGQTVDGVEETDGIEINLSNFGELYPKGILVVQDGYNFDNDSLVNQNFKIVPFDLVLDILD